MRNALWLGLLLLGCKSGPDTAPSLETKTEPVLISQPTRVDAGVPEVLAVLERGPCFGRCPMFTATVRTDGTVVFQGERFVSQAGMQESRLTPSQLDDLVQAFESRDIWGWKTAYTKHTVTDMATVVVTYKGKTIKHYLGDDSAPKALVDLEEALPGLMHVQEFISGGAAQ